ncbi:integrin beta-7 [Neoarius graeffei]|uniref:integrin beta-7 n=1 Tax=Neoarius graeffei TaxID=443677 RepID=UPI00298D0D65|nr:integrin beta-7 [Neoarius graeffei]XP_060776252.1 integrin beta-7 [Neoarius graeffei]XP_060776253.1 integrin beta-7 [Neoarius graeffei]
MRLVLTFVLAVHLVSLRCTADLAPGCQQHSTCTDCVKSPGCAWCKQEGFLNSGESDTYRCDSAESLRIRNCQSENVINPRNDAILMKDNDLNSDPGNVVQLKPQSLKVQLRIGVPQEFKVEFKRAKGYPIDLYYLMDLSYSMKDDLEEIKKLGQEILKTLQIITQSEVTQTKIRIGFGSFVDKDKLPYVTQVKARRRNPCPTRTDTCEPAFTFHNVLPLTEHPTEFKKKVSEQKISGNLDSPEAGLDAIMQAAVCQKIIGWGNVTRILVYTSDDTFHMAGDGRLAGIFKPHDGKCHLKDGVYDGTLFDYPSVGHLSQVLQANNIQLIFAVTKNTVPAYEALSALIPQSVVGELANDSSNVVHLISEAYGNLSSTLLLEHNVTLPGLQVSYKSHCNDQASGTWQHRGECTRIRNEKVSFTVRLNATECLADPKTFEIHLKGINEVLKVTMETLCDCECGAKEENSQQCGGKGTLDCGVCRCNTGYIGQYCDCESNNRTSCRRDNSTKECSGRGVCECGRCKCSGQFSGKNCECDDTDCERYNNKICNGKGKCVCGECKCSPNYTGSACECSTETSMCQNKSGKFCSGHGNCSCNRCECNKGFGGDACNELTNACTKYKDCMACTHAREGCSVRCGGVRLVKLEDSRSLECIHESISYEVKLDENDNVVINYAQLPHTIDKTSVIIGSSVSSIIFIGILIIIIYKILLELYDRREYRNFLKAQENTKWNEESNPLYKGATTTVLNPLHFQDN